MNLIALRDWPTVRQWIQVVAAAVLVALVNNQLIASDLADVIITFVVAVLPPALSIFNSASGLRTWLYTFITAGQAAVLALDIWTTLQVESIVNVLLAVIGAGVAVTHTPTPGGVQRPPSDVIVGS